MPSQAPSPPLGPGLPEPLEALLLAAEAMTRPADRLQHLCAALEALLKTLVSIAMADLIQACGADEAAVRSQLDVLVQRNSDGTWLTTLQSLARELGGRPDSWLGPRWRDLGDGRSAAVQALMAAVARRNEFAHPNLLELLHNRKHAAEMHGHLAEALAQLPWLRELAVVRPRDVVPTVSGYDGVLLVAGPKPERLDGRWTGKLLPDYLYLYDRVQQRLLCLHPWLIAQGHELAGVQRALVIDDLRNWPKLSWKNAAIGKPLDPASVGQGADLAAWLLQRVPAEARGGAVEIRQPTGAFVLPVRPAAAATKAGAGPAPSKNPAQSIDPAQSMNPAQPLNPAQSINPAQPRSQVQPAAPAAPRVAATPGEFAPPLPSCSRCAGALRSLQTGYREPVRGSILVCASCQSVYHAQEEPGQLSRGTLLRRLWEPAAPRLLTTLQQAELLRPDVGKSRAITSIPHVFSRQGGAGAAAWLGRIDDGRWLIVAAQGVPLRDDHGACEAAQLGPGSRFALNGVEMVLARAP
jgi:hypothetical protein